MNILIKKLLSHKVLYYNFMDDLGIGAIGKKIKKRDILDSSKAITRLSYKLNNEDILYYISYNVERPSYPLNCLRQRTFLINKIKSLIPPKYMKDVDILKDNLIIKHVGLFNIKYNTTLNVTIGKEFIFITLYNKELSYVSKNIEEEYERFKKKIEF